MALGTSRYVVLTSWFAANSVWTAPHWLSICQAELPCCFGPNIWEKRNYPSVALLAVAYHVSMTVCSSSHTAFQKGKLTDVITSDCQLGFDSHPKDLSQCSPYENQTQYTV